MIIEFWVAAVPKPQPRARIARGRKGVYNPPTADAWREAVGLAAKAVRPAQPFSGPLRIDITWYLPRPGYMHSKKWPNGPVPMWKIPDRDNFDKSTLDAMEKAEMYRNDGQACFGEIQKWYCSKPGQDLDKPGALIYIVELDPMTGHPLEVKE